MAEVKWIKVSVNIFDDEKLQLIGKKPPGDTVIVIWFMLLTLAGKQNNGGVFMLGKKPYTARMFSKVFGRPTAVIERAITILCEVGLLEINDGVISIPSWSSHQSIDRLNELKRKSQEKKDKDIDIDKDKDKELFKSGFSPPTLEEVVKYCSSGDRKVDPIRFYSYYTACGWKIGKKPIENWQAAIEMWEAQSAKKGASFDISKADKEMFNN